MMNPSKNFTQIVSKKGMKVTFCDFGAAITSIKIPLDSQVIDVVLGFDHIENYQKSYELNAKPFLGAVVGLHAGRVNGGKYNSGEQTVQLEKNIGKHHLHGGTLNLSNQFWKLISQTEDKITYSILVNDGKTQVTAIYHLKNFCIQVTLTVQTKEEVLINLTQHSYFNLQGHDGDVTQLKMKINADRILETDNDLIPTGKMLEVKDTKFNFLELNNCPAEIDTSFVLNNLNRPAAILYNPINKLRMEVCTNQPTVHVYVGGACAPLKAKGMVSYHNTSGICFEVQNYPDSPNHANFKNGIVLPEETYVNEIEYNFFPNSNLSI